jgi:hypothetical protein
MATKTSLTAAVRFMAEAYNPQIRANVPAHWIAEVDPQEAGVELAFGSGDTQDEALADLKATLKAQGCSKKVEIGGTKLKQATRTFRAKNGTEVVSTYSDEEALEICAKLPDSFANELAAKAQGKYGLSDAQMVWVHIKAVQANTPKAERPSEKIGSVKKLVDFFDRAAQHLNFPKVRLQLQDGGKLIVKRTGKGARDPKNIGTLTADNGERMYDADGSRNRDNRYYGRVQLNGTFEAAPACTPEVVSLLQRLMKEPEKVGAEYGRLTGNCAFCNAKLTDERSTAVGYGETCAGHWGLPYPTKAQVRKPMETAAKKTRRAAQVVPTAAPVAAKKTSRKAA